MESILKPEVNSIIIERINSLSPESKAVWGKMNVTQMLGHVAVSIQAAIGEIKTKRAFMGYILGGFAKKMFIQNDKPFSRGAPSAKEYIIPDGRNFEEEKSKLIGYVKNFTEVNESVFTENKHSFFGNLTHEEWDHLIYKHLDHHLKQFGA